MQISEEYMILFRGEQIGVYYVFEDGSVDYRVSRIPEGAEEALRARRLAKPQKAKKPLPVFADLQRDENRVPGTRKRIWAADGVAMEFVPRDAEKFWVYRRSAEKGEDGYSPKRHSAPHREGGKEIEGMEEWASWYCFNKKEDGMFEAELDEAWWWGGGHNDGGTIRTEVPEAWLALPYDEFLDRVVTLSAAAHYGFTAEDLKEKPGLRAFFGF